VAERPADARRSPNFKGLVRMRKLSNRQRQILELLLGHSGELAASEIASQIRVSTRTVHRELTALEPLLADYGASLYRQAGLGLKIVGDTRRLGELANDLRKTPPARFSPEERKLLLLCELLEKMEPVKLFALAHDLQVATGTVSADLDELEPWIRRQKLVLVRRRGYGVEIGGRETARRKAISLLILEHVSEAELFGGSGEAALNPAAARLLGMLDKERLPGLEHALWEEDRELAEHLPENRYMELLTQLAVALDRIRRGFGADLEASEREAAFRLPEYSLAGKLAKRWTEWLPAPLPEAEVAYLALLLYRAREERREPELPERDFTLLARVKELVRLCGERLALPLEEDSPLAEGLLAHLGPALERLRQGGRIRNPLLQQIRKEYADLFATVREAADEVFTEAELPDEEIGYLAMHVGAAVERTKQLDRKLRAVLVCGSGIGTSRMLASRLGREVPQLDVIGSYSWYEISRIPASAYDLIISTIDLPEDSPGYLKVSPLLTEEEAERLRRFIREHAPESRKPQPSAGRNRSLEKLRQRKALLEEILGLIDGFRAERLELPEAGDMIPILAFKAEAWGAIDNALFIAAKLKERERMGSQVIPGTEMALVHTRDERVLRPFLSLFRLDRPLTLGDSKEEVRHLLLMLGPLEMNRQSLEVLSEISASLLEEPVIRILQSGSEEEIRHFLADRLADYFETKLEQE